MKCLVGFIVAGTLVSTGIIDLHLRARGFHNAREAELISQSATGAAVRLNDDDLRIVVDARHPPFSAIGRFRGTMTCTAAIVLDPRIIVTASHCIADKEGILKDVPFIFEQGYQEGHALGRFRARLWSIGSRQHFKTESVKEASEDWAILLLDTAPLGVQPFALSLETAQALKSRNSQMLMPSYSIDFAKAESISLDPACSVRDFAWDVLVHNCRASFGSSGAPLLIRRGQEYAVAGVHTGSLYASDNEGRAGKLIGNRAISSHNFAPELVALSNFLKTGHYDAPISGTPQNYAIR